MDFLLSIVVTLLCITVHEVSHGLAAYALGDPTAKSQRRLSLNPIRHIDPFGFLLLLVAGFGWAKPVPVDTRYFKHPKSGMALTALAGPVSNFLFAYLAAALLWVTEGMYATAAISYTLCSGLRYFFSFLLLRNLGLGLFNLIPFPPLDGSKVVEGVLPDKVTYTLWKYEHYGMILLIALTVLGVMDKMLSPLTIALEWLTEVMLQGSAWVFRFFV